MTRYLVAAASRETVAAACDYLDRKLEEEAGEEPADDADTERLDDEVYVLTVEETARPVRDMEAVSRAAQARLADRVQVRTIRREGSPDREIVAFVRDRDIDEVVLGPSRTGGGIGSTTRTVLSNVEVPVFVVPA